MRLLGDPCECHTVQNGVGAQYQCKGTNAGHISGCIDYGNSHGDGNMLVAQVHILSNGDGADKFVRLL